MERTQASSLQIASSQIASSQIEAARWRLLAAIAAGFGLVSACGGLVQGSADEMELGDPNRFQPPPGPSPPSETPVRPPAEVPTSPPMAGPMVPTPGGPVLPPAEVPVPPRDGEVCYSLHEPDGMLGEILPSLPPQAFASSGCLTGRFSGWLEGGGCSYDPQEAVLRDGDCCYVLTGSFPACGRPFIVSGAPRVASARADAHWPLAVGPLAVGPLAVGSLAAGSAPLPALPRAVADRIGHEWLRDALAEHASVASFAAFGLSLLAVGAPPELLRECQQASLDEIEHARACFGIAQRYLCEPKGPGALELSDCRIVTELEAAAVRAFLEGCVEETIAALTAAAQLEVATDSAVRTALERIAADEARHAELAWKFVAWAIGTGGVRIARAVAAAAQRITVEAAATPGEAPMAAFELQHFHDAGRLGPEERAQARRRAISQVIRPSLSDLSRLAATEGSSPAQLVG